MHLNHTQTLVHWCKLVNLPFPNIRYTLMNKDWPGRIKSHKTKCRLNILCRLFFFSGLIYTAPKTTIQCSYIYSVHQLHSVFKNAVLTLTVKTLPSKILVCFHRNKSMTRVFFYYFTTPPRVCVQHLKLAPWHNFPCCSSWNLTEWQPL